MRRAGLDVDPDAPVSGLPYGVRKRIEVVRALMSRPRLLMLDEPAAGLNPRETAELSAFLKSVAWDGLTLLVVEHDMSFVHDLCDRTVVLNFGRLIYDGPTRGRAGESGGARGLSRQRDASRNTRGRAVLLEVSNLDVRYGRNHAVKGLNLTVAADELVTVLGSNGAGKSSLLRALQGLVPSRRRLRSALTAKTSRACRRPSDCDASWFWCRKAARSCISLSVHENLQMGAYCRSDVERRRAISKRSTIASPTWRRAERCRRRCCRAANSRCWRSAAHCWPSRS